MELGQKLKQARLDAGLSQRQLCGDTITRNMLSLIENGSAQPSMDTLRYFAQRLGKPMSYFLEEGNQRSAGIDGAWAALAGENPEQVLALTLEEEGPEGTLLRAWARLALAEAAIESQRFPYARSLLAEARNDCRNAVVCSRELERRRLLLAYRADPQQAAEIAGKLEDDELILRADAALADGAADRCAALLDSAASRDSERWIALRAESCFTQGEYHRAAELYKQIEGSSLRRLEQCYEKLGDYKMAYHYACRQREQS